VEGREPARQHPPLGILETCFRRSGASKALSKVALVEHAHLEIISIDLVRGDDEDAVAFAQTAPRTVISAAEMRPPELVLIAQRTRFPFSTAALGFMFAMLVGSGITRPVYRLLEGTREVEAGHFDKSIPVTTRDEIGQLSIAFNRMIEGLAQQ
jgi:HAMP domain-containing protein